MFSINDYLVYGIYGVCKIEAMSERTVCGRKACYYVLKPVYEEKSTVYVPVDNEALTGKMRRVLSAEEIYALIKSMPSGEAAWIESEQERKREYTRILSNGSREELMLMIKALYTHRQMLLAKKRKPHLSDEGFLKDAEKLLYEEFAYVLNIKRSQVAPFIAEQIEIEQR